MNIRLDLKTALVLKFHLWEIFKNSDKKERTKWFLPFVRFSSETFEKECCDEYKKEKGMKSKTLVNVEIEDAKVLCDVMNEFLVAHPYMKDKFFTQLKKFEAALVRAEKKNRKE